MHSLIPPTTTSEQIKDLAAKIEILIQGHPAGVDCLSILDACLDSLNHAALCLHWKEAADAVLDEAEEQRRKPLWSIIWDRLTSGEF